MAPESLEIPSPIGTLRANVQQGFLISIDFIDDVLSPLAEENSQTISQQDNPIFKQIVDELNGYFLGKLTSFSIPLMPLGSNFSKGVWTALMDIPFGTTISYATQAQRMQAKSAIRAIAAANGKNPIPIIIPCHRVIGSNGNLTGYSGGLWRKQWLLIHEGAMSHQEKLF
ncbi:MAG: methylated-DNA--[protein]-cysteine S-methyltransferase [Bacteroidia bacterium]|nr:methylated-DNA--[protein]-cysteine S-methyltransferase [Bacteroidia bacterium]